jgi:hypothetical protein
LNLKRRIERIEALRPLPPAMCPACGSIDFEIGEGTFYGGVLLSQDDGTHDCFCKLCARSFNGRISADDNGRCLVREARLCEFPI